MSHALSKSARIVSHLLDQSDAAQGGDGPRCPVGRLLRQGGEASMPHSLQTGRKLQEKVPLRSSTEPFGGEAGFALAGLRSGSP